MLNINRSDISKCTRVEAITLYGELRPLSTLHDCLFEFGICIKKLINII